MLTPLQKIVLPATQAPSAMPLYLDAPTIDADAPQQSRVQGRSSLLVTKGAAVSFASYFNAFAASYWQHHTVIDRVRLTLNTAGTGVITVLRSDAHGAQHEVESRTVQGDAETVFDLPLQGFDAGGWYWFDLAATDAALLLLSGEWATEATPTSTGKLCIGITTFNKPDYCVRTLEAIADDAALAAEIDRIFLVDQGTQRVTAQAGFAEVAERLGDALQPITQGNLGGSGGFSRAMAETLDRDASDFLLILDDDVEIEPESALRGLQFARFTGEPTIVGGHMFDLNDAPVMHAWAEIVDQSLFFWGPSNEQQRHHDFRVSNLRQTPWMHERLESDYNGWWMCLIPKRVIAKIGLSLPVFIKWDDAEYGLRAKEHGVSTVSLPGMALWHIAWADKDDTQDWQAFFHTRNRIIAGLLHSQRPTGGGMLDNCHRHDIKKLLNMQYYAVALAVEGLRDVLAGPAGLHERMPQSMPGARALAQGYPEMHLYREGDDDAPTPTEGLAPSHDGPRPPAMTGLPLAWFTVKSVAKHWVRRDSERDPRPPRLKYAKRDAFWWVIPSYRSVLVETAERTGTNWYRHDRRKFRSLLRESGRLTRQIRRDWSRLSAEYREALPEITSVAEWRKTFEGRS